MWNTIDASGLLNRLSRISTFPDYGHGSLIAFGQREPEVGGMSSVFIVNTGGYNEDLGSAAIECNVTAREVQQAIKIVGGSAVEIDADAGMCKEQDQPSAAWLPQLTFLAQVSC